MVVIGLCLVVPVGVTLAASHGPDVTLEKTASVASIPAGGSYSYQFVLRNIGSAAASGVRLIDRSIEPDVEVDFSSLAWTPASAGSCQWKISGADPNNLTCDFGTLSPGATVTVTLSVTAPPETCPRVRNTASITASNEPEANTANNSSVVNVSMTGCPDPSASPTPRPAPTVSRLFGADRYETAVKASKLRHPSPGGGVAAAYVATGLTFPDALAGAPAAGRRGASILLVSGASIPAVTRDELLRLQPSTIYVLGGPGAVSDSVVRSLRPLTRGGTGSVVRLSGPDRYATAAAVVDNAFTSAQSVIVATGMNFPDALAGSAPAARFGMPILLVRASDVPAPTAQQLTELRPKTIYILGGTGVISAAVEVQLRNYGASVIRIAGDDRYLTATGVTKAFYGEASRSFVATGRNFPDALSAGPLGDPVLLTDPLSLPSPVSAEVRRLSPSVIHVLGGPAVISDTVLAQLRAT